jgi:hypothetical protein
MEILADLRVSLLAGVVTAIPAQIGERTVKADCRTVNLVVKVWKIAPGAAGYCLTILINSNFRNLYDRRCEHFFCHGYSLCDTQKYINEGLPRLLS